MYIKIKKHLYKLKDGIKFKNVTRVYGDWRDELGYGYEVKWNDDIDYGTFVYGLEANEFNSIYIISDTSRAEAAWMASPSTKEELMFVAAYHGQIDSQPTGEAYGFRPIVCLRTGVKLKKLEDGSYQIMQ